MTSAAASFITAETDESVVILSFFEKKKSEPWEEWTIKLNLHEAETDQQRLKFKNLIVKQLRACLLYISSVNVSETLHIPSDPASKSQFKVKIYLKSKSNGLDQNSWC